MPLLHIRPRTMPQRPLTALEIHLLDEAAKPIGIAAIDFEEGAHGPIGRADARRALSALWRRGLLTRVGWGDTAVYRRRP